MIITCPDCATSYELPGAVIGPEGRLVQCDECRTIWTQTMEQPEPEPVLDRSSCGENAEVDEFAVAAPFGAYEPDFDDRRSFARAPGAAFVDDGGPEPIETLEFEEVQPDQPGTALAVIPASPHPEAAAEAPQDTINVKSEAARLARASASARLAYQRKRQNRVKTLRGWSVLAASVMLLTAPAVAFPRHVTVLFPAAAQLYAKAGVYVNTRGLEFREISYRRVLEEGAVVLEIEGKVVNVSENKHLLAPLHVSLLDDHKQSLYSWTLKAEPETVEPEGAATFKTRLAAPPAEATNLRVRFALPNETN